MLTTATRIHLRVKDPHLGEEGEKISKKENLYTASRSNEEENPVLNL